MFQKKFLGLYIFLLLFSNTFATNLRVGKFLCGKYFFEKKPTGFQFEVRNDSTFSADTYKAKVTIKDEEKTVVFEEDLEGKDLQPYKKDTLSVSYAWTPQKTGYFDISVKLEYEYDVIPSDNEKTVTYPVIFDRITASSVLTGMLPSFFPDLENVWAFMPQEPLEPGDKLASFDDREYTVSLDSYKYMGWVDWGKDINFSHPGYYVTIDAIDSSKVDSTRINWYPTINGVEYLGGYDERLTTEDRVYGTDPEADLTTNPGTVVTPTTETASGDSICVLLVTGSEKTDKERDARLFNIDVVKKNLMNESMGSRLPEGSFATLRYPSQQEIVDKLKSMKNKYKCIYFYYTGHGWNGGICTNDSARNWLGYYDLARELYETNAKDIKVIIDACHAGSAIERFDSFRKSDRNVTVLTACSADTLAWRYVIQDDGNGNPIWGSFFTWSWVQCYGEPNADTDSDQKVTLVEAFDWVRSVNPSFTKGSINSVMNPQKFTHRAVEPPVAQQPVSVPDSDLRMSSGLSEELDMDIGVTVKTYTLNDEFYISPYGGNVIGPCAYKYYNTEYYFDPAKIDIDTTKLTFEFKYQLSLDIMPFEGKIGLLYRDSTETEWNAWENFEVDSTKQLVYGYDINKKGYWALGSVALTTDVDGNEQFVATPFHHQLKQNYPNPFNPQTTIVYSIPATQHVEMAVYDILGRKVSVLLSGIKQAGIHKLNFNAKDLSSGTYFVRIEAADFSATRKMVYTK